MLAGTNTNKGHKTNEDNQLNTQTSNTRRFLLEPSKSMSSSTEVACSFF